MLGFHECKKIGRQLKKKTQMERESKTDKFAVEVQKSKNVVGHIMIGKTGRFAKTIF